MDIVSHGLWAGAAYKAINLKREKALNVWLAAAWGVFPDLFAFTVPFLWLFWHLFLGDFNLSDLPRPHEVEPVKPDTLPIFQLASMLYNFSHSVIVFLLVFGVMYIILRRPVWEMGGWLLHIIMDIPTHTYQFFPTPFLWPISGREFSGFSWATPWFLILNYSTLLIAYILLRKRPFRKYILRET
ncbi:MAG: hypothetical protein WAP51_03640 [Candidatus Sungiibacteriota bacterium]